MSLRSAAPFMLLILLSTLAGATQARPADPASPLTSLVYVDISGPHSVDRFERTGLPAYAHLSGRT